MLAAAFWVSLLAIAYAYVGYPLVLWLLSRFIAPAATHRAHASTDFPSVTLIVSAFNEERVIAQKIENALALDYPRAYEDLKLFDLQTRLTEECLEGWG